MAQGHRRPTQRPTTASSLITMSSPERRVEDADTGTHNECQHSKHLPKMHGQTGPILDPPPTRTDENATSDSKQAVNYYAPASHSAVPDPKQALAQQSGHQEATVQTRALTCPAGASAPPDQPAPAAPKVQRKRVEPGRPLAWSSAAARPPGGPAARGHGCLRQGWTC